MYLDSSVEQTEVFEGRINHMYQDSKGNVTVAVGVLLASIYAARSLPFLDNNGNPASALAIEEEWNRVKSSSTGHVAAYYRAPSSLTLTDAVMDRLLFVMVRQNDERLQKQFTGYLKWPDEAKIAALDMLYNLGAAELFKGYPRLNDALEKQEWMTCAAQCGRDVSDPKFINRNVWTRRQFIGAHCTTNHPATQTGQ